MEVYLTSVQERIERTYHEEEFLGHLGKSRDVTYDTSLTLEARVRRDKLLKRRVAELIAALVADEVPREIIDQALAAVRLGREARR